MQYKNKFGITYVLNTRHYYENKTIGLSMSGGCDSTMLCYLLANTIQIKKMNTAIQPYNGFDLWCPEDSSKLPAIIEYLQQEFPDVTIHNPICTVYDTHGASSVEEKNKNYYIRTLIEKLKKSGLVDIVINGVCLGPPVKVQKTFTHSAEGLIFRREGHALFEEVTHAGLHAPFTDIDKRFIIQCYKDFEQEHLLDMTHSCTFPGGPCNTCWWCQERQWAINQTSK